ncbi:hypothetical protein [Sulfitobacter geojensis]|uniref:hypothetical protein n=1 Tax=Sulfitobacter geojensis TaxID=1342299 RepID=UPI0036DD3DFB
MAKDTQDQDQNQDVARGSELLASLHDAITDLRQEIEGLAQQRQSENTIDETAAKQSLGKLRELVTQCAKAENYLNECKSKQAGIAKGGYALDLDRARVEIGCKLDRLRRCGRPRAVP